VRTAWVVGADGYGSLTRRLLASDLAQTGPPMTYALLEFEAPVAEPTRMTIALTDGATDVLWPLGSTRGRFGLQVPPDSAATAAPADPWDLVHARAPWFERGPGVVDWETSVAFRPCLARSFGGGRVWLAGDAAHLTSPVGVQSMNVGLREAHDLGRRLAAILRGVRETKLLRFYNEEREREWKMLLGVHDRLRARSGVAPWVRALGPRLVAVLPASGHDLNLLLDQVGLRLHWLRGRAGRRAG
jgi:3-(3-hydroxy-phenyl)propionate hydroxylase